MEGETCLAAGVLPTSTAHAREMERARPRAEHRTTRSCCSAEVQRMGSLRTRDWNRNRAVALIQRDGAQTRASVGRA